MKEAGAAAAARCTSRRRRTSSKEIKWSDGALVLVSFIVLSDDRRNRMIRSAVPLLPEAPAQIYGLKFQLLFFDLALAIS